jgi:hydrogenase expression/formation protein HypC
MCLAVPVIITKVEGKEGEVEIGGVTRGISLWLTPEAKVGDYVLLHTGYAISVLDQEEAQETLKLFQEIAESATG